MPMRHTFALFSILLLGLNANAQARHPGGLSAHNRSLHVQGVRFAPVDLFLPVERSTTTDALWSSALREATVLRPDARVLDGLLRAAPRHIALHLPGPDGGKVLELERVELAPGGVDVIAASGGRVNMPASAHYRGIVRGSEGSLAAISVFDGQVMGLVSDGTGDHVLGPIEGEASGLHVFYNDDALRGTSGAACHTDELPVVEEGMTEGIEGDASRTTRCVRLYWEVRYEIFQQKGGMTNTVNYMTGLYNQTATLYANDDIDVTLSQLFVWDTADPYTGSSTSSFLDQFGVVRTSFNGDLAHLIGYTGGGGIAWLNTLCNGQIRYRMAYSGISSSYASVPTYSWSVEVITHEQGHNMGSQHTHACAWNGNNTAIDGCGPAAGYDEGCSGPLPSSSVGGTIMSYCHLTSSTIKFANGFGSQPTARITSRVNAATCLGTCGTTCDAPTPLTVSQITQTAAQVSWPNTGATSYTLQWKASSSGTWTTVSGLTGTSHPLNALNPATSYDARIQAVCGSTSSAYSATNTFSTLAPCPDAYEPNNTLGAAAAITIPITLDALIATSGDVDHYSFTLTATGNIFIGLTSLPANYNVRLLSSSGTQLAISQQSGTTNESITYNGAAAGTYVVHVLGVSGANNAIDCYTLSVSATGQDCLPPAERWVSDITYSSAVLNWQAAGGAGGSYDLQWRRPTDNWTSVNGLSTTSHPLSSLLASTLYEFRVRRVCQQMTTGPYSEPVQFTTLAAPCEVAPPALLSVRVYLDGPFRSADGLMADSLRIKGLIPLQEPYSAMGHAVQGPTSTTAGVLSTIGNTAIVDWVLVELRDPAAPANVVERRVGLVQRNGWVVRPDGTAGLPFCSTGPSYYVAVRHRNHLGAMTSMSQFMNASGTTVDFATFAFTYGTAAQKQAGGFSMLWAGNAETDGLLLYTGEDNDRDPILQAIGGVVPTVTVNGYRAEDVDLDGVVRYTGANNDRDRILQNIGGVVPTQGRAEQLP